MKGIQTSYSVHVEKHGEGIVLRYKAVFDLSRIAFVAVDGRDFRDYVSLME